MHTTNVMTGNNAVADVADRAHNAVERATAKPLPALERTSTALANSCGGDVGARPLISMAGAMTIGYLAGKMLR